MCLFILLFRILRPPRTKLTDTRLPCPTLCRSTRIGAAAGGAVQAVRPVSRPVGGVAALGEAFQDVIGGLLVVFDDQDTHRSVALGTRPGAVALWLRPI